MPTASSLDRRSFLIAASALAAFASCRRSDPSDRCAFCGMRISPGSHWMAGATDTSGRALVFDTPGCLFRYRFGPHGSAVRDPWITEYYGPAGRHTDARAVRYAVGSDVAGPMGPDLVPVDPARADTFARDHHARAMLSYDDVTAEILHSL